MFWLYAGFVLLILAALALDLLVIHKQAHVIRVREALFWTGVWVVVALAFSGAIFLLYENHVCGLGVCAPSSIGGGQAALQYISGYLIEKSLSIDNIFVIALIMAHFRVPGAYQHRILFWGVLGVLVLRGVMIGIGAALFAAFTWTAYLFGGLLLFTALKMWRDRGSEEVHPDKNVLVRLVRKVYPVSTEYDGPKFFTRLSDGRLAATPLLLVILTVEVTDLIFALDSIPAVFAVTTDPFLVFTSNVFAILGLRSLFFAVHDLMSRLHYMKPCLVVLLAYIGVKLVLTHHVKIPTGLSLGIIAGILGAGVVASLLHGRDEGPSSAP